VGSLFILRTVNKMWKYSPALKIGNLTRACRHLITAKRRHSNLTWITIHTPDMCLKRHFCCAYNLLCNVISFTVFFYLVDTKHGMTYEQVFGLVYCSFPFRKQYVKVSETWIWLSRLRTMSFLFHSFSLRNVKFQTT